jgi:PTH1 family peptidyl-tRNA hydrolase
MFLIAGLGNPDKKYEKTRHNIGFDTVDALAEKYMPNGTCGVGIEKIS